MGSDGQQGKGEALHGLLGCSLVCGGMVLRCIGAFPTAVLRPRNSRLCPLRSQSLCPDCQHMVRDILQPLFDSGVADLARLRYIAYGKVKDGVCQHGATECKFNRYINCAQAAHADQRDWFPYVRCLADNMRSMDDTADECAAKQGWKPETLSACAGGAQGAALEKEAGAATLALEPKLTFVPWVLVNDVPIGADFENLDRYICAASSGADRWVNTSVFVAVGKEGRRRLVGASVGPGGAVVWIAWPRVGLQTECGCWGVAAVPVLAPAGASPRGPCMP